MLNPEYFKPENIEQIKQLYSKHKELPQILLPSLFTSDTIEQIQKSIQELNYKKDVEIMKHSYSISQSPEKLKEILNSKELLEFLSKITNKKIKNIQIKNYKLEWKDHTLLHDSSQEQSGIDIIIDLTENWNPEWGGSVVYTDNSGTYYTIPPSPNTLIIIERKKGTQKFIQYINNKSKENKRYLALGTIS